VTVFIPVRDVHGLMVSATCVWCGQEFVNDVCEEHLYLVLIEHAASHDRK
jgi:hypothetical protein